MITTQYWSCEVTHQRVNQRQTQSVLSHPNVCREQKARSVCGFYLANVSVKTQRPVFAVWATYTTTRCQDNARLVIEHNVLTNGHLARVGEHNVGFAVWATYTTTCCQDNARLVAEHNVLTSGHLAQRFGQHNVRFCSVGYIHNDLLSGQRPLGD